MKETLQKLVELKIDLDCNKIELSTLKQGQIFKGNTGNQYIFLEKTKEGGVCVLRKDLLPTYMKFGDINNFDDSEVDQYLNDTYINELEQDFGTGSIVEHDIDLLSMDGLDDYGAIRRKVSLLPFDIYRRYRKFIGDDMPRAWWLIDPESTPSGWSSSCVRYFNSDGNVCYDDCGWGGLGVRPFFVLQSSILVSCNEIAMG